MWRKFRYLTPNEIHHFLSSWGIFSGGIQALAWRAYLQTTSRYSFQLKAYARDVNLNKASLSSSGQSAGRVCAQWAEFSRNDLWLPHINCKVLIENSGQVPKARSDNAPQCTWVLRVCEARPFSFWSHDSQLCAGERSWSMNGRMYSGAVLLINTRQPGRHFDKTNSFVLAAGAIKIQLPLPPWWKIRPRPTAPKALKVITFIASRMVYWQKDFPHVLFRHNCGPTFNFISA